MKSDIVDGLPWAFTRVHKDTDRFISENIIGRSGINISECLCYQSRVTLMKIV